MVEVLEAASLELADAALWYDERVSGLGERFLTELHHAFGLIERFPMVGSPWLLQGIPDGVRHVLCRPSDTPWSTLPIRASSSLR